MVSGLDEVQYATIAPSKLLKYVVNEFCRERIGVHSCNRWFNISTYKKGFSSIDFFEIKSDKDTWWYDTKFEIEEELFVCTKMFVR